LKKPIDYQSLQWIVYVFLAGAIYAVLLKNFVDWYNFGIVALSTNEFWAIFFIFGAPIFFAPIILSFFFTRFQPEKRLVPPLMIAIVAFGMTLWFYFNKWEIFLPYSYLIGSYVITAGLVQDTISIYFLGINAKSNDIIRYSFAISCNELKAKEIVNGRLKELFGLWRKVKNKGDSFKLKSRRNAEWKTLLEVKASDKPDQSIVNMVFYKERRYDIKPLEEDELIADYARNRLVSLKDYLVRNYSVSIIDLPEAMAESAVNYVLDDCKGAAVHIQEMPLRKQISIIFGLIFIAISIGSFVFNRIDWGLASIPIALVLLVDSLRD